MQGGWNDRKHTDLAVYTALSLLRRALTEGYDVVLDEGNLYPAEFAPFLAMAQMMKKKVVVRVIQATPEVCKERCLAAGGSTAQCMEIDRKWEVYQCVLKKK